jgi:hypothetical protein
MKKIVLLAFMLTFAFCLSGQAAVYQFMPTPSDLYGLDHDYAYNWGINWNHTDEIIHEARLTFYNIHDWRPENDDILYINMVDNAPVGLTEYFDNEETGDFFAGQGVTVGTWTDPGGSFYGPGVNVTFSFNDLGLLSTLNNFASDGNFGLTFDPDCHYFNDGVKLEVITSVPEPATFVLFGIGAVGLAAFRKKRS